ncbi:hypothetical protein HMSSN139_12720 [Paenibacillus sp. HMSSN-139]|nr:hypothetical protein HMSSN139_12720 [Paenibacillus sp. HMSSN-139]
MKSICVFAGSRFGEDEQYRAKAELLGKVMAQRGYRLIYGDRDMDLWGRSPMRSWRPAAKRSALCPPV